MAVTLRALIWDDTRTREPLLAAAEAFAATPAGNGLSIDWLVVKAHDYHTKHWDEICRDVDLALIDYGRIGEAVAAQTLVQQPAGEDDVVADAGELFTWDGATWATPVDVSCHASLVNASAAWDLPLTFDRVAYIASPLILGMPMADASPYRLLASLLAGEGLPITDDGFPKFSAMDVALYRLLYLKRLCHPNSSHWYPDEFLGTMKKGVVNYAPLVDATATMARTWQVYPAPLPQPTTISAYGLATVAGGRDPELAAAFARFAGSHHVQTGLWLEAGGQPAHRAAWDLLAAESPLMAEIRQVAERAVALPRFPTARRLELAISRALSHWMESDDFMAIRESRALDPELRQIWATHTAPSV